MRQPLVPAPSGDGEAGGAGPVHEITDQGRLVAVGEAVDYACRLARRASSGPQ